MNYRIEDPYLGYIVLDGRPFSVRERSPYKNSFDLSTLKDHRVFNEFVEQVSVYTFTFDWALTIFLHSRSPWQLPPRTPVALSRRVRDNLNT